MYRCDGSPLTDTHSRITDMFPFGSRVSATNQPSKKSHQCQECCQLVFTVTFFVFLDPKKCYFGEKTTLWPKTKEGFFACNKNVFFTSPWETKAKIFRVCTIVHLQTKAFTRLFLQKKTLSWCEVVFFIPFGKVERIGPPAADFRQGRFFDNTATNKEAGTVHVVNGKSPCALSMSSNVKSLQTATFGGWGAGFVL